MGELLLGCSGWNYPDTADKGGWTGVFYSNKNTKRLRYYSQFVNTAEMKSVFYDKFYSQMTKGSFIGIARATPLVSIGTCIHTSLEISRSHS
jgi:uncharacterized protein YecE (DUF72 family)